MSQPNINQDPAGSGRAGRKSVGVGAPPLTRSVSLGYALGDLGINLYFISVMTLLLNFYTDQLGISAAAAAGVLAFARFVDAITDPLMGALAERTRTRWGRLRPYLLLGALPLAGITVLTFYVPDLDEPGRVIWAYVTYTLFGILYTVVTIPYSMLTASLTDDHDERTNLSALRMGGALTGAAMVSVGVPLLLGEVGSEHQSMATIMGGFGVIATILLAVTFVTTKEVVNPPPKQRLGITDSLRAVVLNPPLLVVISIFCLGMLSFTVRQSIAVYYFIYNLGRPDLLSWFFGLTLAAMFVGLLGVPWLASRLGKARAIQAGALLSICACLGLYLTPFSDPYWVIFWSAWVAFGGAPIAVLGWAMIPDTVEYAQWRFGKRADGAIYSMASFFQKLAKTLGGAGVAAGLAVAGYVANQEQSLQALEMIHAMMSLAPMAFMALALVIAGLYRLDAQTHDDIRRQLASAQSGEEAASA